MIDSIDLEAMLRKLSRIAFSYSRSSKLSFLNPLNPVVFEENNTQLSQHCLQ